jgi:glycosyltransferase involved in cell wall biosynthesis
LILGEGEQRGEIEAAAQAEGVGEKVIVRGFVSDPMPYYRSADLFVLSSDYEGFGNVIVEALACGLPVVSTDCPSGPAEILENGRYGRLVPVGDDEALAQAMQIELTSTHDRDALVQRANAFLPDVAAEQYLRLMFPSNFTPSSNGSDAGPTQS